MSRNDFFNGLGETLAKNAKKLSSQAEDFYGRQKKRGQILLEKRDVDKILAEIGKVVYKNYKDGAELDEELIALCEEIDLHQEKIDSMKEEMADLTGKRICPNCQASVERDALYCPSCGEPLPEEEEDEDIDEDIAEAEEEIEEELEEAAEEVKEAADEIAEDLKEAVTEAAEEAVTEDDEKE